MRYTDEKGKGEQEMGGILGILALVVAFQYMSYQIETKDKSIQGFIEWLKQKYYYKK